MLNESMWFAETMLFALWAGAAVKSTVVLGVAWLVTILRRRRSAAMRHLVWAAAAVAVLALPFFSLWLPSLRIPSVATIAPAAAALFDSTATVTADDVTPHVTTRSGAAADRPIQQRLDWRLLLMSLWAAGAAAAFTQMLFAFAAMSRIRRASRPSPDGQLAAQLASQLQISHAVDVLETAAGSMPMTWGIQRPAIFVPSDATSWTAERRRMVLLHELAHVRRGDVATHLAARLALILNWWNPLAWIAWREFLKERERATDDLVLHCDARASEYAAHLLDVARAMQSQPALAWGAVAMARRSELEGRLVAILDPHVDRKTPGRGSALVAALVAMAMAAPFAALRAQDPSPRTVLADIYVTIQAATAQNNYEMLEKPAEAFEAQRQYDNAKKLLDAAVAIRAQVAGAQSVEYGVGLMQLADLEKQRNRPKDAEEFYTKAVHVLGDRPQAARALIYLGVRATSGKNYQQAGEYFQKAQNLDAAEAGRAQMWMALLREREQNPAEAELFFKRALAVEDPNSRDALTTKELYARLLKNQGREQEADALSMSVLESLKAAGAQQPQSDVPHVGAGIISPRVLSMVDPEYTEEGRVAKYQGSTMLSVDIGPDGFARNIRITRGLGFGLDENAVTAVQQWRFQPATKDGVPLTVEAAIEVNFRLL
jgi:TonB family protein